MPALTLGPLALPLSAVFLLAGILAAIVAALLIERKTKKRVEPFVWLALGAGLIAARAVFVLANLDAYSHDWPSVLYLWQDGYSPWAGAAAAGLVAIVAGIRTRRPAQLITPVALGTALWLGLGLAAGLLASMHELPDVHLQNLEGEEITLSEFYGRPMVINLWATWCPPCRREMPVLAQAQQKNKDIHVIFINQREAAETVQQFLNAEELMLENALQDPFAEVADHFGARAMPTTLFVDASGRVRDSHMGELSRARLHQHIRHLKKLTLETKE
ncbi:MAG TPA: TlpA disulfide reductase family protein [Wenzhouxiangella sp.]|nr:TlpA disulfide reductase family protein [Wenzhouxiangella sp.]